MDHTFLLYGVLLFMGIFPSLTTFQLDSACGVTVGCLSDCYGGGSCTYMVSWQPSNSTVKFKMTTELSNNADQYLSFGLSPTQNMDDASVSACLLSSNGARFSYENSYNHHHKNVPVSNPTKGLSNLVGKYIGNLMMCTFERSFTSDIANVFSLSTDYYVLYADGPVHGGIKKKHKKVSLSSEKVNMHSIVNIGEGSPDRIKAHGSIAIIAWMLFVNLGTLIARYFKPIWSSKTILGSKIWFHIHRLFLCTGAILTITAFCVIIQGTIDVGDSKLAKAHPYMGITILCLVCINPIVGFFRPDIDSKYRPIFYWFHCSIGLVVTVIASVNIFFGIKLRKAGVTGAAFIVLIVFEVLRCSMIVVFEGLLIRENNIKKNEKNCQINNDKQENETDVEPYAWKIRKILMGVHTFISVTFTIIMVILVATSTSSS